MRLPHPDASRLASPPRSSWPGGPLLKFLRVDCSFSGFPMQSRRDGGGRQGSHRSTYYDSLGLGRRRLPPHGRISRCRSGDLVSYVGYWASSNGRANTIHSLVELAAGSWWETRTSPGDHSFLAFQRQRHSECSKPYGQQGRDPKGERPANWFLYGTRGHGHLNCEPSTGSKILLWSRRVRLLNRTDGAYGTDHRAEY
jgi:hypothetical protein